MIHDIIMNDCLYAFCVLLAWSIGVFLIGFFLGKRKVGG